MNNDHTDQTFQNRAKAIAKRERLLAIATTEEVNDEGDPIDGFDDVLSVDTTITASVLLEMNGPTTVILFHFHPDGELRYAELMTTDTEDHRSCTVDVSDEEAETLADFYCAGLDSLYESARYDLDRDA